MVIFAENVTQEICVTNLEFSVFTQWHIVIACYTGQEMKHMVKWLKRAEKIKYHNIEAERTRLIPCYYFI